MKPMLEVGDVIYRISNGYSGYQKYQVVRVTKTQAVAVDDSQNESKFKREILSYGSVDKIPHKWDGWQFYIATPKLDEAYKWQCLIGELDSIKYKDLSTDQFERMVKISKWEE